MPALTPNKFTYYLNYGAIGWTVITVIVAEVTAFTECKSTATQLYNTGAKLIK